MGIASAFYILKRKKIKIVYVYFLIYAKRNSKTVTSYQLGLRSSGNQGKREGVAQIFLCITFYIYIYIFS